MCVVSFVGDFYRDQWKPYYPNGWGTPPDVGRAEFDQLKRQVEEMKELLKRAAEYDKAHGQPDCQNDDKMAILRQIAAAVGIKLEEPKDGSDLGLAGNVLVA